MALFIFNRDLRVYDNTALKLACENGIKVLPIFVFPPEQIDNKKNEYFSHPAVQFMCESLKDLNEQLAGNLCMFNGNHVDVLEKIHKQFKFEKVYFNTDYSVYAKERDRRVNDWCKSKNITVNDGMEMVEDFDLMSIKECLLDDGRPYSVLAQYYKKFLKETNVRKPVEIKGNWISVKGCMKISDIDKFYVKNDGIVSKGGRKEGMKILEKIQKGTFKNYGKQRDFPAIEGTTRASPHLKFGTISVREFYWKLRDSMGKDNPLIRELVFRSFYIKIYSYNLKLQRGEAYRKEFDKLIPWKYDKKLWNVWVLGKTGYPMCDAGMRQLATEAWVHNRVRMLVASIPTRYFLIDWRRCMKYFYQHLVDADIFSNTAGWGFTSGIGVDAAPYFRAPMNPFIQSKKFDPDCEYIKKWIPELKDVDPKDIHRWNEEKIRNKYPGLDYPAPVIEQKEASRTSLNVYKTAGKKLNANSN